MLRTITKLLMALTIPMMILSGAAFASGMQIFIQDTMGHKVTLDVASSDTFDMVKQKYQDKMGVPPARQRIVIGGKVPDDGKSLADYKIRSTDTLHMVILGN